MSKPIIKVENVSKRYRLGLKERRSKTLAGQVGNILKSPWENFQRLRKLSKFGEEDESVFWALKDINFEVNEGEVLGIIGKNGAGKSTLLKILSQITEPTSGRITLNGRVASLLEVGTGFHPELTGRENIYMNGTILGMTRREIDRKLDEIIDFSGIEKFVDTPVKFYSSGMKVRLGFSVAAHLEPEILVIDEVLAVGDYEFQQKCLGKMEDVSKNQGRTVLFVSHNMGAVRNLCSRAILIENGSIKCESGTSEVLKVYVEKDSILGTSKMLLTNHPDKKLKGIGLLSACIKVDGEETNSITTGQSLEIILDYKVKVSHLNMPMEIGFGLFDSELNGLLAFNNRNFRKLVKLNNTEGKVIIRIDEFPMYRDELLSLSFYFGYLDTEYEVLHNVGKIRAVTSDYLRSS